MRRTKIVCTMGPACEAPETLKKLMESGMNVARLNFSHGSHEEHGGRIAAIRRVAAELGKNIALMLDTKGPEIRTGLLKEGKVTLKEGDKFTLTTEQIEGDATRVSVSYAGLPNDVKVGDTILIDDGLIGLTVQEVAGTEIHCVVQNGGDLGNRKGVNVPNVSINLPAITEKDIADINFAIDQGLDFIAASFIRKASDVLEIRKLLEERNADIHIISKIENQEGVDNLDEILQVSDGLMVARGDLGVEIPVEEVPLVQKLMIEKCNKAGKPVITATQMLDSMIRNPRPTRAETTDVANAIFDGTDAIMLSGETAAGKYPVLAVQTMAKIAERTEKSLAYQEILKKKGENSLRTITDAISHASCTTAFELGAAAIITPTTSGSTARMVSKYRPQAPVIAATPSPEVMRKLAVVWGVYPVLVPKTSGTDEIIEQAVKAALDAGLIKNGDLTVITAGIPAGVAGTTNLLKVHIVGDVILQGTGIGFRAVTGEVCIAKTVEQAMAKVKPGDILVTVSTDADFVPAMKKASAIITEVEGLTSHAAIVGLELGIPVIVGAKGATTILEDGQIITLDTQRGVVYRGITKVL